MENMKWTTSTGSKVEMIAPTTMMVNGKPHAITAKQFEETIIARKEYEARPVIINPVEELENLEYQLESVQEDITDFASDNMGKLYQKETALEKSIEDWKQSNQEAWNAELTKRTEAYNARQSELANSYIARGLD